VNAARPGRGFKARFSAPCNRIGKQFSTIGLTHVELERTHSSRVVAEILAIHSSISGDRGPHDSGVAGDSGNAGRMAGARSRARAEEVLPMLNHLPWLTRVWPMPRQPWTGPLQSNLPSFPHWRRALRSLG